MAKIADSNLETMPAKEARDKLKSTSAKSLNLPKTPSGAVFNSPEGFFNYCKQLTSDQWSRTRGYLYRLLPAIRRKPSYIDRFTQPIDAEYVLHHALGGSGRYQILLNDRDGAGTFCKCILDLADPEFPPRYNIHELDLTSDDNRQLIEELKQEGKLNQNGDVIEQRSAETGDATMAQALKDIAIEAMRGRKPEGGLENQAFSKMLEMMASASKQSIEIALGQVKKDDPASFLALLTTAKSLFAAPEVKASDPLEVLSKAKEIFGPKSDDGLMKLLMQQLDHAQKEAAAERQRNHDLQVKMLETKNQAGDPFEMVKKVVQLQEQLGGGERSRRPGWPGVLEEHAESLIALGKYAVDRVGGAINRQPVQTQQARPQGQQTQQPRPAQTQQPQWPAQPATQPQPQTGATTMPANNTNSPLALDPEMAFLAAIFEVQGRNLVAAFAHDPESGADVARTVSLFAGLGTYQRIRRMGVDKILATIDLLPDMKADLAAAGTAEMFKEFIEDFIAGDEEPDDDSTDDDDDDLGTNPDDPASPEDRKPVPVAANGGKA